MTNDRLPRIIGFRPASLPIGARPRFDNSGPTPEDNRGASTAATVLNPISLAFFVSDGERVHVNIAYLDREGRPKLGLSHAFGHGRRHQLEDPRRRDEPLSGLRHCR